VIDHNRFAAGGVNGRFQGQKHITGTANGKSAIFRRIAAHAPLEQRKQGGDRCNSEMAIC
jgi:hypothetical protein